MVNALDGYSKIINHIFDKNNVMYVFITSISNQAIFQNNKTKEMYS